MLPSVSSVGNNGSVEYVKVYADRCQQNTVIEEVLDLEVERHGKTQAAGCGSPLY